MRIFRLCIICLIFFTCFGQSITEDSHSPCGDSSWVTYKNEKCFKYIDEFKIPDETEKICNQQLLHSDPSIPTLVSIKSEDEQEFLNNFLFNQLQIRETVWISAKMSEGNSLFLWNDGSLVDYTNWSEGSPINETGRNCVEMRSPNAIKYKRSIHAMKKNVTHGKWFNVRCDKRNLVLCQKMQNWSISHLQNTLLGTRRELENVKKQLSNHESTINNLQQNPVPIDFIYVQLSGQPEPKTLWPEVGWVNVTSDYAGLFFRAGGENAAPFGFIQSQDAPRLSQLDKGHGVSTVEVTPMVVNVGEWSLPIYTGRDENKAYAGENYSNLRFYVSDAEVRPRNQAVLIWRRNK